MELHIPLSRSTLGSAKSVRGGFHDLTHNQKQVRQGICQGLLNRYEREGNNFLHRMLTLMSHGHITILPNQKQRVWSGGGEGSIVL